MADELKTLKTRVALLYKTYAEWTEIKDTFIPLKGEVCFCEIPEGTGVFPNEPCRVLKVGDGTKTFAQLDWLKAEPTKETLYKIVLVADNKWRLEKSIDNGTTWEPVDDTVLDFSDAMARIKALEDLDIANKFQDVYAQLNAIIPMTDEEIHFVIDN